VGGKRLVASYRPDVATALMAALGAALLLPLALLEGLTLRLPAITWGAIVVLGLGSGALANLFWLHLLSRVEASHASLYLFLIPVISTALSVVGLGEPLTLTMIVGALLVLAGMAVAQRPDGQERREGVKP
jgi:drug/metabolite transporter (DMT)-like permease